MAPAILIISAAVAAAGSIQQGVAANREAEDQQKMADYNASVEQQKAKQIEAVGVFDSKQQAEEADRLASTQSAALGASGAVTTEGSPLLIKAKQAAQSDLENLLIGYNARVGANAANNQANLDIMQGKLVRKKGENEQTGSYFSAGSSLLKGFGSAWGGK